MIGIISAMDIEMKTLVHLLKDKKKKVHAGLDYYTGKLDGVDVVICRCGVGKVNAAFQTADAIHGFNPDLIINVGVAGGLADDMKRGSVAIGTEYVQVDMKTLLPENSPVIAPTPVKVLNKLIRVAEKTGVNYRAGRIATGDFVLYERKKRKHEKLVYRNMV